MRLILHSGAHKTATTYIQSTLAASRQALRARGVGYLPLEEMRKRVTHLLGRNRFIARVLMSRVIRQHRGCERLILSDENLSGLCSGAVDVGTYYPQIGRRAERLLAAASVEEAEVLFAVRSYDRFVSSMYCEHLRHRPFLSVGEYLAAIDVDGFSWRRIVAELCRVFGQDRVTLWRFEDFRQVEDQVFAALCGVAEGLDRPARPVRESLSQRAVAELEALAPQIGREHVRAEVDRVAARLPKDAANPAFEAFAPARAAELRARYDQDMRAIASDFPRVRIISRNAAAAEPAKALSSRA